MLASHIQPAHANLIQQLHTKPLFLVVLGLLAVQQFQGQVDFDLERIQLVSFALGLGLFVRAG